MKLHTQIITQKGNPAFVVIPYKEYEKLLEAFENLEDIEAAQQAKNDTNEYIPFELVKRIGEGESPIKVYREYRKISQTVLAKKLGVSRQYISQIEAKERTGTAKLLKKIAKILNVEIDDLI